MAAPININANLNLNPASINASAKQVQQALGRITGQASEFQKSLDASTARVFAFGATTAVINGVTQSFKALVSTTINVQAKLTEINSILGAGAKEFNQYRNSIFNVAKQTGQSFNTVAGGAAELARQGLGAEESAKRLKAALILTRISGLSAEQSVKALTAAMNGFTSAGLTAEQIVNKIVAVDTAFAVSAQDLADGFSRAGSTAEDAGVKFEELLALITAVEQRTARGGAVIGNAFKSIFTRISRGSTIEQLKELGVAINANQTGIQKLKALSQALENVADPTIASEIKELAGGVFQINVVSSTLKDLSSETSVFGKATKTAFSEGNAAMEKNAFLQEDLLAKLNVLTVTVTSLGERLGNLTIGPALKSILSLGTSLAEGLDKALDPEKGNAFVKGLFSIIGKFISGPGLAIFSVAFFKIFKMVLKFAKDGFKSLMQMGSAAEKVKNIEGGIVDLLQRDLGLRKKLENSSLTQAQKEKAVLDAIKKQNALLKAQQQIVTNIAAVARKGGVTGFSSTTGSFRGKKGRRFAAGGEGQMEPDLMTALVNESREAPRGASPFVTNFRGKPAVMNTSEAQVKIGGREEILTQNQIPRFNKGTKGDKFVMLTPKIDEVGSFGPMTVDKKKHNFKHPVRGIRSSQLKSISDKEENSIEAKVKKTMFKEASQWTQRIRPLNKSAPVSEIEKGFNTIGGAKGALSAAVGSAFEVGIKKSLGYESRERDAGGDFDVRGGKNLGMIKKLFGINQSIADMKSTSSYGNQQSFVRKVRRELGAGAFTKKEADKQRANQTQAALKKAGLGLADKSPAALAIRRRILLQTKSSQLASNQPIKNYAKGSNSKLFGGGMKKAGLRKRISRSRVGKTVGSLGSKTGSLGAGFGLSAAAAGLDALSESAKQAGNSTQAAALSLTSSATSFAATGAMIAGPWGAAAGIIIGLGKSIFDSYNKLGDLREADIESSIANPSFMVQKALQDQSQAFKDLGLKSGINNRKGEDIGLIGFRTLEKALKEAAEKVGDDSLDIGKQLRKAADLVAKEGSYDAIKGFRNILEASKKILADDSIANSIKKLEALTTKQFGKEGAAQQLMDFTSSNSQQMEIRKGLSAGNGKFSSTLQARQGVTSSISETASAFSKVKGIERDILKNPSRKGELSESLEEASKAYRDSVLKTSLTLQQRQIDISNQLVANEQKRLELARQITADRVSSISNSVKQGPINLDLIEEFQDKFKNLTSDEDRATLITDFQDQVSSKGSTPEMRDQLLKMAGIGVKGGTVSPKDLARIQGQTGFFGGEGLDGGRDKAIEGLMSTTSGSQTQKELGVLSEIDASLKAENEKLKSRITQFAETFDGTAIQTEIKNIADSLSGASDNFKTLETVSKDLSAIAFTVMNDSEFYANSLEQERQKRSELQAEVFSSVENIKKQISQMTGLDL
ncbi:phage tail tape measure protein [bacterium]|nr:phage tail tape measure protein [bacterium]